MNLYLFIYLVLLFLSLILLINKQKSIPFLKVGWFFHLLIFAYYGFPLLYVIYFPNYSNVINRDFSDFFIIEISSQLMVLQISFLAGEFFIRDKYFSYFKKNKNKLIRTPVIVFLIVFIYILFFYRWSSMGGFLSVIGQSRIDYMTETASQSGLLARYDILFYIITALLINNILIKSSYIKENKILFTFYICFIFFNILMGMRLLLLVALISTFAVYFMFYRRFLIKNKIKILITSIVFILALSSFATIRQNLKEYFAGENFRLDQDQISLVPSELFTGLLSHHSIENGVKVNEFTYFRRLLPNSLNKMLGNEGYQTYTQDIAKYSRYSSGRAVYTVPLLTDLYFSVNRIGIAFFLIGFILYYCFNKFQYLLLKRDLVYLILFYILIYYVFRAETPVWFGRLYLSFFLLYLVMRIPKRYLFE